MPAVARRLRGTVDYLPEGSLAPWPTRVDGGDDGPLQLSANGAWFVPQLRSVSGLAGWSRELVRQLPRLDANTLVITYEQGPLLNNAYLKAWLANPELKPSRPLILVQVGASAESALERGRLVRDILHSRAQEGKPVPSALVISAGVG